MIHILPDPELIKAVEVFGNLPSSYLNEPELMELLLPTLRADFTLIHDYYQSRVPPETLPMFHRSITIFGGMNDPWTSKLGLADWSHYCTGSFELNVFPGGHFFLNDWRSKIWDIVTKSLAESSLSA